MHAFMYECGKAIYHCEKPARSYLLLFVGIRRSLNLLINLSLSLMVVIKGGVEIDKGEIKWGVVVSGINFFGLFN